MTLTSPKRPTITLFIFMFIILMAFGSKACAQGKAKQDSVQVIKLTSLQEDQLRSLEKQAEALQAEWLKLVVYVIDANDSTLRSKLVEMPKHIGRRLILKIKK